MIPPGEQWAVQIDVTNACNRKCSNCTRPAVAHSAERWFMSVEQFRAAVDAVRDFPSASPRDRLGRPKVVGMIGGEPLLHPQFEQLCGEMLALPLHARGLWTGLDWKRTRWAGLIQSTFGQGYINNNQHSTPCFHQPVLAASCDLVPDVDERARLIARCPMQAEWASNITRRGFFFCEVAGALADVLPGPPGLPLAAGVWRAPLAAFGAQIDYYCQHCGVCIPLQGRRDAEETDDISRSNLELLTASPRVQAGGYVVATPENVRTRDGWRPCRYLRQEA
jgi:hypothetical protein